MEAVDDVTESQYIGKFESRCEYLYDEAGIDFYTALK